MHYMRRPDIYNFTHAMCVHTCKPILANYFSTTKLHVSSCIQLFLLMEFHCRDWSATYFNTKRIWYLSSQPVLPMIRSWSISSTLWHRGPTTRAVQGQNIQTRISIDFLLVACCRLLCSLLLIEIPTAVIFRWTLKDNTCESPWASPMMFSKSTLQMAIPGYFKWDLLIVGLQ